MDISGNHDPLAADRPQGTESGEGGTVIKGFHDLDKEHQAAFRMGAAIFLSAVSDLDFRDWRVDVDRLNSYGDDKPTLRASWKQGWEHAKRELGPLYDQLRAICNKLNDELW